MNDSAMSGSSVPSPMKADKDRKVGRKTSVLSPHLKQKENKGSRKKIPKIRKSNFSAFITRSEVEFSLAKMIESKLPYKEIDELGTKFDEISDEDNKIDSSILITELHDANPHIQKAKIKELLDYLAEKGVATDKIYFNQIMNEIRILKEFKKRDQLRMVIEGINLGVLPILR